MEPWSNQLQAKSTRRSSYYVGRISEEKILGHYYIQMSFEQEEILSAEYSGIVENLFFFQVTSRTEAKINSKVLLSYPVQNR